MTRIKNRKIHKKSRAPAIRYTESNWFRHGIEMLFCSVRLKKNKKKNDGQDFSIQANKSRRICKLHVHAHEIVIRFRNVQYANTHHTLHVHSLHIHPATSLTALFCQKILYTFPASTVFFPLRCFCSLASL